MAEEAAPSSPPSASGALSAEQRARALRNRERARSVRAARRAAPPAPRAPLDSGGGFLLEEEPARTARAAPPAAPLAEAVPCAECGARLAHSYLLETFDEPVCDACRDAEGAHALLTCTQAKEQFLLRDADLDLRAPPLRCVRRRNPHAARGHMRLYLRAHVEARALLVWGGEAALRAEEERRARRRGEGRARRGARALRALRMAVRSSLFEGARAAHEHAWGAETYDAAADVYSRACACGHRETYEKM